MIVILLIAGSTTSATVNSVRYWSLLPKKCNNLLATRYWSSQNLIINSTKSCSAQLVTVVKKTHSVQQSGDKNYYTVDNILTKYGVWDDGFGTSVNTCSQIYYFLEGNDEIVYSLSLPNNITVKTLNYDYR
jgi:hypothetical protein